MNSRVDAGRNLLQFVAHLVMQPLHAACVGAAVALVSVSLFQRRSGSKVRSNPCDPVPEPRGDDPHVGIDAPAIPPEGFRAIGALAGLTGGSVDV